MEWVSLLGSAGRLVRPTPATRWNRFPGVAPCFGQYWRHILKDAQVVGEKRNRHLVARVSPCQKPASVAIFNPAGPPLRTSGRRPRRASATREVMARASVETIRGGGAQRKAGQGRALRALPGRSGRSAAAERRASGRTARRHVGSRGTTSAWTGLAIGWRISARSNRPRGGTRQWASAATGPGALKEAHSQARSSAPRYSSAKSTKRRDPMKSGVRSCRPEGVMSRMSRAPSEARPPAASHTKASGAAS